MRKVFFSAVFAVCLSTATPLSAQNPSPTPRMVQTILKQAAAQTGTSPACLLAMYCKGEIVIEKGSTPKGYTLRKVDGGTGLLIILLDDEL